MLTHAVMPKTATDGGPGGPAWAAKALARPPFVARAHVSVRNILRGPSVQAKLKIGAVDDPAEREADAVAEKVMRMPAPEPSAAGESPLPPSGNGPDPPPAMPAPSRGSGSGPNPIRRMCTGCEDEIKRQPAEEDKLEVQRLATGEGAEGDEEELVQPKEKPGAAPALSSSSESAIRGLGGGAPLASSERAFFEPRFGLDFSNVRIHNDSAADQSTRSISARAYTWGSDIAFAQGEYTPGTSSGRRLLAHELTHVVQQNGGLDRKPEPVGDESGSQAGPENLRRPAAHRTDFLQAKLFGTLSFGPTLKMPSGTLIHKESLPLFATSINPELFIEAPIPGGNKSGVGIGKRGKADFYRGKTSNRTIGINFNKDGEPISLGQGRSLKFGGGRPPKSAPRRFAANPKIRNLDQAPTSVELADLKPGHSAEEFLGVDQLSNYKQGVIATANGVNKYLAAAGSTERWNVSASDITSMNVPDKLAAPSSSGFYYSSLAVYENGKKKIVPDSGLKGSMIVYKSDASGIWAYEWVPENIPATTGSGEVNIVLKRLNTQVIDKITDTGKKSVPRKVKSGSAKSKVPLHTTIQKRSARRHPVRRKKKFNYFGWKTSYGSWKRQAKTFLGKESEQKKGATLEAIVGVRKRTGAGGAVPAEVKARAKGFAKIKHWQRLGGLYGWLRNTFDRVYVKLQGFAQSVKKKVKRLSKSVGGSSFGGWVKAAAKAIFKVFKMVGSWAVTLVADKLIGSLQEGISKNISKLVESITPEGVQSKIEEVHALKAKYETIISEGQAALEERLFGDKLKLFSELKKFEDIANTFSTIVNLVQWGVRILACFSPPGLGCLWNLAISALQYMFAKLMQTCWFSKKTFEWIKEYNIRTILNFPATLAGHIVTAANKAIPLPEGMSPLFATISVNANEFKIDCASVGGGGVAEMTPEQQAVLQLVQEIGEEKFKALIEMMLKRGAGPQVQLTAERVAKLKPLLKNLTVDDLRDAAEGKVTKKTTSLEEFLKDIATYSPAEHKIVKERNIDYKKAKRSNPKYEKSIKWKAEKFVRKGLKSDTNEFADAIYDVQRLLGVTTDGMAGPVTTMKLYEKNRLPRDGAYRNAAAQIQRRKLRRAISSGYPGKKQLEQDLQALNWSGLSPKQLDLVSIEKRKIIYLKTTNGVRLGGYYKDYVFTRKGKKTRKIIDVSRFLNLDPIKAGDSIGVVLIVSRPGKEKPSYSFGDFFVYDISAKAFLNIGDGFIGLELVDL